jgi:threonine dehydrogenase-like Zn-dependent dehydrogenase
MCRNGRYTERGIKKLDGYASNWWTVPESYAVRVDDRLGLTGVLTEPTSVVAKAWEQIDRIGGRAWFEPRTVLVTGAGPIGLLAAMIGVQRGLDVHVLDRVTDGVKPELVARLGATYHHSTVADVAASARPDVVVEATGVGAVVFAAIAETGSYGIVCLTGVSPKGRSLRVDAGGLNRDIVLENDAVVGSVNANLRHYQAAAEALAVADPEWLSRLLTTTVPLEEAASAFERTGDDIKVVITLDQDLQ